MDDIADGSNTKATLVCNYENATPMSFDFRFLKYQPAMFFMKQKIPAELLKAAIATLTSMKKMSDHFGKQKNTKQERTRKQQEKTGRQKPLKTALRRRLIS